jgi:L-rhamnose mutarotase
VNVEEMYDNMMNKFKYGNIADPKVYLDENTSRMCHTHRMMFAQLVGALMAKNDTIRAQKALDYCSKMIPATTVRHDYVSTQLADYYYKLHQPAKANAIMDLVGKDCVEYLTWYFSLNSEQQNSVSNRIGHNIAVLQQVLRISDEAKQKSVVDKYLPYFMDFSKRVKM